jgi:hypothetical protein
MRKNPINEKNMQEEMIRLLIREYTINYRLPGETPGVRDRPTITSIAKKWLGTIAAVAAVWLVWKKRYAIAALGSKLASAAVTAVTGGVFQESKRRLSLVHMLLEANEPKPGWKTVYGDLYSTDIERVVKEMASKIQSANNPVIKDNITPDEIKDSNSLSGALDRIEGESFKALQKINDACKKTVGKNTKDLVDFNYNLPNASVVNDLDKNNTAQVDMANQVLCDAGCIEIFNVLRADINSIYASAYDQALLFKGSEEQEKIQAAAIAALEKSLKDLNDKFNAAIDPAVRNIIVTTEV